MPLRSLQPPESVVLKLSTLTPLYTGGIGQHGEQLHPSGLLGSLRHFSGLVARALGDRAFAERVWGNVNGDDTHAKQVAVRWDGSGLVLKPLQERIQVNGNRGWFFNEALSGNCQLILTRRGINDTDWQLLLLALRIQIRHGTLGARDQFGMGVMRCENLPMVAGLAKTMVVRPEQTDSLWHSAFFKVTLTKSGLRKDDVVSFDELLKLGLSIRYALRNSLRGDPDTPADKALRHKMLGALNEFGSATNVSAAYPLENNIIPQFEVRLVVQLKLSDGTQRTQVMKAFNSGLKAFETEGWRSNQLSYEWGGSVGTSKTVSEWINHLAGV